MASWDVVMRRVWLDDWQMQCCGTPFAIGSEVSWSTFALTDYSWFAEFLVPVAASKITDHEDHHSEDDSKAERLRGVVWSIDAVYCRYRLDKDGGAWPVPSSGVLEPRERADGWEEGDVLGAGRSFVCYLVDVGAD